MKEGVNHSVGRAMVVMVCGWIEDDGDGVEKCVLWKAGSGKLY
jgi:hypothetical protein